MLEKQAGWRILGALLPGEVRRRLFEPAAYDLLREHLARGRRYRLSLLRMWLSSLFHGLILSLSQWVRVRRVFTKVAIASALVFLIVIVLLSDWMVQLVNEANK